MSEVVLLRAKKEPHDNYEQVILLSNDNLYCLYRFSVKLVTIYNIYQY